MEVSTVLAWLLIESSAGLGFLDSSTSQQDIPTVDKGRIYRGVYGLGVAPYGNSGGHTYHRSGADIWRCLRSWRGSLCKVQEVIPTIDQGRTYGGVHGLGVAPNGKFRRSWQFGFIHVPAA